jgi:hypothetical protein
MVTAVYVPHSTPMEAVCRRWGRVVLLVFFVVGMQAIKAARVNPADSLRNE